MTFRLAENLTNGAVAAARREGRLVRVNGEDRVYGTRQQADSARASGVRRGRGRGRGGNAAGVTRAAAPSSPTSGWVSSVVEINHVVDCAADTPVSEFVKFVLLGPTLAGHRDAVGLTGVEDLKIQGVRIEVISNAFISGYTRIAAAITTATAGTTYVPAQIAHVAGAMVSYEMNVVDTHYTVGLKDMETLRKTGGAQGTLVFNLATQAYAATSASRITYCIKVTVLKPSGTVSTVHELA